MANREEVLVVEDLKKYFTKETSFIERLLGRTKGLIKAVDGVSFTLKKKEVLALVGESGSGKTTTGKLVIRLLRPTSGKIIFQGSDITWLREDQLRRFRTRMQMIYQDPYSSLDPRMPIGESIAEPLIVHKITDKATAKRLAVEMLEKVGLSPGREFYNRKPHQLSGGQRQRAVIARAMILEPELVVADEPVSMVDVSLRASILKLIDDFRREYGVSVVFITHDLGIARLIADRIAVMYLGRIVEMGPTESVISRPRHPYTAALITSAPSIRRRLKRFPIYGEIADPSNVPEGCRYHPRCPLASDLCKKREPVLTPINDVLVACHYPLDESTML